MMQENPPRPHRLHHNAYVSQNLELTRQFYEDIIGLPMTTTWCETGAFGDYCHAFFELADGGALAFFQFADESVASENIAARPTSRFYHIALAASEEIQSQIADRARNAGLEPRIIDHGYCESLYLTDPDKMTVELTVDHPAAVAITPQLRSRAHRELARWLAGDHTINNDLRALD